MRYYNKVTSCHVTVFISDVIETIVKKSCESTCKRNLYVSATKIFVKIANVSGSTVAFINPSMLR